MRTELITIPANGRVKKVVLGNFIRVNSATDRFTVELTNSVDGPTPTVATLVMARTSKYNTEPGIYFTDVELINDTIQAINCEIVVGVGEYEDNLLDVRGGLTVFTNNKGGLNDIVVRPHGHVYTPANPSYTAGNFSGGMLNNARRARLSGYFSLAGNDYPIPFTLRIGTYTVLSTSLFNRSPASPTSDFVWAPIDKELWLPSENVFFATGLYAITSECQALAAGSQLTTRFTIELI